jgi:uncharacterized protein HemX
MMIQPILGVIGTAVLVVVALVTGAVGFYLGLKKHPKFASKVDAAEAKAEAKARDLFNK